MTACPYCLVHQQIDLAQVNRRNLGPRPGMPCPRCDQPLVGEELRLPEPPEIDRCPGCHGLFSKPEELEPFLARQVPEVVWLDHGELSLIAQWWRAGGQHHHAADPPRRAAALRRSAPIGSGPFSTEPPRKGWPWGEATATVGDVISTVGDVLAHEAAGQFAVSSIAFVAGLFGP